jgi:hypothetical protein
MHGSKDRAEPPPPPLDTLVCPSRVKPTPTDCPPPKNVPIYISIPNAPFLEKEMRRTCCASCCGSRMS